MGSKADLREYVNHKGEKTFLHKEISSYEIIRQHTQPSEHKTDSLLYST